MHFSARLHATCPARLDLLILMTFCESEYYEGPHYAVFSSLLLHSFSFI